MAITGKLIDFRLVSRILTYARPHRKLFFWSVSLTILLAVVSPLRPWLVQETVDKNILTGDTEGLIHMTLITLALLFIQSFIQYRHTYLTNSLGQVVILDMRTQTFNHILSLKLSFFDRTPVGQLITRTISDLETIADVFSEGLIEILGSLLQIVAILLFMFASDLRLSLIVLVPIPFFIAGTVVFQQAIKTAFQKVRSEVALLNTFLQEHITGISVIRLFAREEQEYAKFKKINGRYTDANISSNFYYSVFFPFVEIIMAVSIGLLVWYGSRRILNAGISPGIVVSFILYLNLLFRPIRELADKFNTLQMGMVSADRIFKLLDVTEQTENKGLLAPANVKGKIEFKGVWFAYVQERYVLQDIGFSVEPGKTIALVGATGAGKSSVINLLNRFYDLSRGEILLDGQDIRLYRLDFLRSKIVTIMQDVFLFSDSIAGNISFGDPAISRRNIEEAAKRVGATEFINRLPEGFDFEVMERGGALSAGQAQLLSFIRAMVYDPAVLVLDEATSSVDTETEEMIQRAVLTLMKGRTSVVIAHRLSTIQHADTILVFDQGRIVERGNHQELLRLNGQYKKLYELQFSSSGIEAT